MNYFFLHYATENKTNSNNIGFYMNSYYYNTPSKEISEGAFKSCSSLTRYDIPSDVS